MTMRRMKDDVCVVTAWSRTCPGARDQVADGRLSLFTGLPRSGSLTIVPLESDPPIFRLVEIIRQPDNTQHESKPNFVIPASFWLLVRKSFYGQPPEEPSQVIDYMMSQLLTQLLTVTAVWVFVVSLCFLHNLNLQFTTPFKKEVHRQTGSVDERLVSLAVHLLCSV
eukprot:7179083-Pyramimonas_sp.AAC.1